MISETIRDRVQRIRAKVTKSNPFFEHRSDLLFLLDQLEWTFSIITAALESQERIAKELVEYRSRTLQTYEHNGILVRERDAALARAEDEEERMQLFEANVAGQLKKLREEKLALESALRTAGQRIEELVGERDARPRITRQMAQTCVEEWDDRCTIDGVHDGSEALPEWAPVMRALREHTEARKG